MITADEEEQGPARLLFRGNRLDRMTREQCRALVERERKRAEGDPAALANSATGDQLPLGSLSPVEAELSGSSRSSRVRGGPESVSVDGVEFTIAASFAMVSESAPIQLPPSSPPRIGHELEITPAEYAAPVRRHFETKTIDEYNNLLPKLTANPHLHRAFFESWISEATATDEPYADEIQVHNNADGEAVPPDMEFEYSNGMLYDHDVPDPEVGTGCTCEGPCNPRSKTCSCVRRQKLYYYNLDLDGFAYNAYVASVLDMLAALPQMPEQESAPRPLCIVGYTSVHSH